MLSCPPRFGTKRSPDRATLGPAVAKVAELLGTPFMPWQRLVADVVMEIDPKTGRLAYSELGLSVPRQSGKSTFVLAKSVHRASATQFFGDRQRMVYTAQTRAKAREKWEEDYAAALEASRTFGPRVDVHKGNGNEHIRFQNGSRFGIEASTESSGHGGTIDEAYIDEAFAQKDGRLEQAFRPAMITRANKLLMWLSTMGWSDGPAYLPGKVAAGRAAVAADVRSGLAYFEWSADEGADPSDESVWWRCMPALGRTTPIEAVRSEYDKAVREGAMADFRRAYLNQSVPKPVESDVSVVAAADWRRLCDPESRVDPVVLAIDVSPESAMSSIAVAGSAADRVHVEITGNAESGLDVREGVGWVVPRLAQIAERSGIRRVVIAGSSATEALRPAMQTAGLEVTVVSGSELNAACGHFLNQVASGRLVHIGQPVLADAIATARKLDVGDGALRWTRRKSEGDITPLYAATLAVWAAQSYEQDYDVMDSGF